MKNLQLAFILIQHLQLVCSGQVINPDCSYPLRNSCVLGGSVFSGSGLCTTDFRLTKGWCLV